MDISKVALSDKAAKGIWFAYPHPGTGEPTDIRVRIASANRPEYQSAMSVAVAQQQMDGARGGRLRQRKVVEFIADNRELMARWLLLDIENATYEGRPLNGASHADRLLFIEQVPTAVEFISDKASDLAAYLEEELGNSGSGPRSGPD